MNTLRNGVESQSLFYWIIYSYYRRKSNRSVTNFRVSILILLDYLFLLQGIIKVQQLHESLNPYFTGLSILI